ncbi:MAG: hypothetical protein IKC48_05520 [Clostridia bacterium]|nr:hypothetical protein [Clostridia bacterium]
MVKKIIVPIVATILVVVIAVVGVNIYNNHNTLSYELYTEAEPWIYESYLENNKVYGAHYKIPNYNPDEDGWGSKYYVDETSPKTRTVVITDEEAFNEIFKEGDLDVDYNKEMLILHIFVDISPASFYKIAKIELDDEQVLRVYYKEKEGTENLLAGMRPNPTCFLVKMKKTDVTAVEFVEER